MKAIIFLQKISFLGLLLGAGAFDSNVFVGAVMTMASVLSLFFLVRLENEKFNSDN